MASITRADGTVALLDRTGFLIEDVPSAPTDLPTVRTTTPVPAAGQPFAVARGGASVAAGWDLVGRGSLREVGLDRADLRITLTDGTIVRFGRVEEVPAKLAALDGRPRPPGRAGRGLHRPQRAVGARGRAGAGRGNGLARGGSGPCGVTGDVTQRDERPRPACRAMAQVTAGRVGFKDLPQVDTRVNLDGRSTSTSTRGPHRAPVRGVTAGGGGGRGGLRSGRPGGVRSSISIRGRRAAVGHDVVGWLHRTVERVRVLGP